MRIKRLLLALSLSLLVGKSFAISFKVDGISYVANADTAIIKGYSEIPENGELTLASTVSYGGKDYRVTTVQNSAFLSCTEIQKLTVPASIKYIQTSAFENCVNMSKLVLEEGEEGLYIERNAFYNSGIVEAIVCRNLKAVNIYDAYNGFTDLKTLEKVTLGENIHEIREREFYGCLNLSSINLQDIENIGNDAFGICKKLKQVDLEKIKCIGEYAFAHSGLREITLPNTLESLGSGAFGGCATSLTKAIINGSITKIPDGCFSGCEYLAEVKYPNTVEEIEHGAFSNCRKLESIQLTGIKKIGYSAFEKSSIKKVELSCVTEIGKQAFYDCRQLKTCVISSTLSMIPEGCFENCESLRELSYPETITSIGNRAFYRCAALSSFAFLPLVSDVGDYAFSRCSSLTDIDWGNVETLGNHAFEFCAETNLNLASSVKAIGAACFYGCTNLKTVNLADTQIEIIPDDCFDGCGSMTDITFAPCTTILGNRTFYNCGKLDIFVSDNNIRKIGSDVYNTTIKLYLDKPNGPVMIGSAMFAYKGNIEDKEYVVPNGVTCIAAKAFKGQQFQIITLNEGLEYIGEGALDNCGSLLSLTIPGTVTYVGANKGCSNLAVLNIKKGSEPLFLGKFSDSNIKKLTLERQVDNIDWMPNLQTLDVGKNVCTLNIAASSLKILNLEDTTVTLDLSTLDLTSLQSMYFGRPITYPQHLPNGYDTNSFKNLQDLTIGNCVSVIPAYFLSGNQYLEQIEIPSSVKVLGQCAFSGCSNLKKLILHDGLETIKDAAIALNTAEPIDSLVIPGTVKEIEGFGCIGTKCKTLILKEGVGKIGHQAFYGLDTDSLTLPSTAKLDFQSFEFCKIKYLDASRYKGLFKSSFASCENLEKVILPKEGMTVLSENEFWACRALKHIELPNTIDSISHSVFGGTDIHEVHIPASVRIVSSRMFCTTNGATLPYKPTVYIEGCRDSAPIILNETFQDGYGLALGKLDVSKNFHYDFSDKWANAPSILNMDSLIIRNIEEFTIKSTLQSHFAPTTAICLSPYLTSCDLWKPTNGKVLVLPGSQLPKADITEMYTVNKLAYEQAADGEVLFDGVNNMPFEIAPVFYQDNKEIALKKAGVYDLSMKISWTSFDGIYPTGLKVTVSTASGIDNVPVGEQQRNCPIYNMNGQRIDDSYKGIVIQNGKKRIAK